MFIFAYCSLMKCLFDIFQRLDYDLFVDLFREEGKIT